MSPTFSIKGGTMRLARVISLTLVMLAAIAASAQTYSIQASTTTPYVCGANNTTLFSCLGIPLKNTDNNTLASVWVHFYLVGSGPNYANWTGTDLGDGSLSSASACQVKEDVTSNGHTLLQACTRLYVWVVGNRVSDGSQYYGPGTINLAYHYNDGGGGAWGGGAGWRRGVTGGAFVMH
jgi:hypothetical protein